jgi:hypothetical protein
VKFLFFVSTGVQILRPSSRLEPFLPDPDAVRVQECISKPTSANFVINFFGCKSGVTSASCGVSSDWSAAAVYGAEIADTSLRRIAAIAMFRKLSAALR